MSKNSKKAISNQDKYTISQQGKLNHSYKFPDTLMANNANNESFTFLHQTKNIFNIFSNYYVKKDENNIKINNFLEKICLLNKQFYINGEKAILTKTSYEKLYDDLFKNLFKQIDCYIEEIQRLNKKIISINSKDDFKEIIKKLNKEINENKKKIKNYENIIKDKNIKVEKLNKEIEYYKKRVIFFKNKININFISKHINTRNSLNILGKNLKAEKNNNSIKRYNNSYKSTSYKYKNKKLYNYLTPSPIKQIRKSTKLISINPTSNSTVFDRQKNLNGKLYYSNLNDNSNNDLAINRHLITVNVDKFRKFFPEKETTDSSSKKLIKLNKNNNSKENLFLNNNITIINKNNIMKTNMNEDNLNEKKSENYELFSPYNYLEDNLNLYSNSDKNNSETIMKYNSYNNNLKSAITSRKRSNNINNVLKENRNNDLNEKNFENTSYFSSNIDLNTYRKNTISNKASINKYSKNKTVKIITTNKILKTVDIKKKLNLNRQNSLNINSNYKNINSPIRNTINGINKTIINKSKINKFNQDDIESIKKKYYFKIKDYNNKTNFNDNNRIKSNLLEKDYHNIMKDIILNTEKNESDKNLKYIQKTDKKLKYKNKLSCINFPSKIIKNAINVNKKSLDKGIKKDINNKNEIIKVLKEINEDYNNNIEMLNYQENEIKFLLNLIDSNEE